MWTRDFPRSSAPPFRKPAVLAMFLRGFDEGHLSSRFAMHHRGVIPFADS
jgi:hypothetical protein